MVIHRMEQGSEEWKTIRKGLMTASNAQAISANGKGLVTYITDLVAEKYSKGIAEGFKNTYMEYGTELEPVARSMYELQQSVKVEQIGFVEVDEYTGCSPDGFVGDDGMIEIKCHQDKKHFRLIVNGIDEIDSGYVWQVQMNLMLTGRKWCDLICYNPNYEQELVIFRIEPDQEAFAQLRAGIEKGKALIQELDSKYVGR